MLYRAAQAMAPSSKAAITSPPEDFKPLVVSVFAHRVVGRSALHFHPEEVRAGRASSARDRGERDGTRVVARRDTPYPVL